MLLTVKQLTKRYNQHPVVDRLDLKIGTKQCVALLGPNGAGKTTTLLMLAGLLAPSEGEITFSEQADRPNRPFIGYLPQQPSFFPWMSAMELLQFVGRLTRIPSRDLKRKCEEMLHYVGLKNHANRRIGGFSGGMKQRLGLAQALLHDPKLLILDEPVSALDPSGRQDVLKMMLELKQRMAILFSTHVLHDAEQVCDEVVMMKHGRVQWSGALTDLQHSYPTEKYVLSTEEGLKNWIIGKDYVKELQILSPTTVEFKLNHPAERNRLLTEAMESGLMIRHFEEKRPSLEDAYMEVMGS